MAGFAKGGVVILLGLMAGCGEPVQPVTHPPEANAVEAKSLEKFLPPRPEIPPEEMYPPYAGEIIKPDTSIAHKIIIIPPDPNTDYKMQIYPREGGHLPPRR